MYDDNEIAPPTRADLATRTVQEETARATALSALQLYTCAVHGVPRRVEDLLPSGVVSSQYVCSQRSPCQTLEGIPPSLPAGEPLLPSGSMTGLTIRRQKHRIRLQGSDP